MGHAERCGTLDHRLITVKYLRGSSVPIAHLRPSRGFVMSGGERTLAISHISISVTYDDLSVTGTIGTDMWAPDLITELANRCTAQLVTTYETLALVSDNLNAEPTPEG